MVNWLPQLRAGGLGLSSLFSQSRERDKSH